PEDPHVVAHESLQVPPIHHAPAVTLPTVRCEHSLQISRADCLASRLRQRPLIDTQLRVMNEIRVERWSVGIAERREELADIVAHPRRLWCRVSDRFLR